MALAGGTKDRNTKMRDKVPHFCTFYFSFYQYPRIFSIDL